MRKLCYTVVLSGVLAVTLRGQTQDAKPASSERPEKSQEYEGPTILSRDKSLLGERGGKLLDYRLYAEVTGIYDSGLTPVATDSSGNLVHVGGNEGVEVGFGVFGSRVWRRDQLSLEYRGSYRHYSSNQYFDGIDQFLNLRYGHVLTRRINLDVKETAGTSSLANGGFTYLPLTDTDLFAVPANELFDNRTYFLQSRIGLVWQLSPRMSLSTGGQGFIVTRQSSSLAGVLGFGSQADLAYRLTRRQTIDVSYGYTHYEFSRTFGNASLQSAALGWSIGLGRRWDFGMQAGGTTASIQGLTQVSLDPAIAAIIGRDVAVVQFDRMVTVPYLGVRLVRRFERSALNLNASTGVSPGNGVYLTSRQSTAGLGYSYSGFKRWTMSVNASYSELSAIGQTLGKYNNYQGGFGSTYKIANSTHMEIRYDYRQYTTQNAFFKKNSQRVSVGLAFSPGERPLPIW